MLHRLQILPALLTFSVLVAFVAAGPPADRDRNAPHMIHLQVGHENARQWPLFTAPDGSPRFAVALIEGKVTPDLISDIKATGASVLNYLPDNALLLRADGVAAQKLRLLSDITALRALPDWTKISPAVAELARRPAGKPQRLLVVLEDHANSTAAMARLQPAARLAAASGSVRFIVDSGHGARLTLTAAPSELLAGAQNLAADPDVLWIEPSPEIHFTNDAARWVGQNYDSAGSGTLAVTGPVHAHGINGNGQVVGHCDDGIDPTHACFYDAAQGLISGVGVVNYNQRKVIYYNHHDTTLPWENCAGEGHGGHTAGTVACDSNGNGTWDTGAPPDGMAPAAKLAISDCGTTDPPGIGADLNPMFLETYNVGARIHTNSWGACNGTAACYAYTTASHDADVFMWEHPDMLIVFAAANEGLPSSVTPPGSAKNIVTVGATNRGTGADTLATFSSQGPASDGRIKPTITAPGVNTNSVLATNGGLCGSLGAPAGAPNHTGGTSLSGTSMATPAVAGYSALIRQYFMDGFYPTGARVPANGFTPSAALLKASLVNGARKMGSINLPSGQSGFGRVSLKESLYFNDTGLPRRLFVDDHKKGLVQGDGATTYKFNVTSSATPFKATVVWTDAPPAIISGVTLVNDLNLRVTEPNGTTYYLGNAFNTTTGFSTPFTTGGAANNRDVEEEVWVSAPAVGVWTVTVTPLNIPVGPQPYALQVTGAYSIPVAGTPVVDSTRISDPAPGNNDGAADPGETVNLQVKLREIAGTAINNLTGTLSALGTPGVTVTSGGPFSFGNLAANGFALNATPFQVALTAVVPCGSLIPLRLTLTDGVNTYVLDFGIRAGSPGKTPVVSVVDNFEATANGAPPDATKWNISGAQVAVDNTIVNFPTADTGANAVHLLQSGTAPGTVLQTKSLDFTNVKTARLTFSAWGNDVLAAAAGPYFRVEVCAGPVATTCAPTAAGWGMVYGCPNHFSGGLSFNWNNNVLTPPAWNQFSVDLTPTALIGNAAANVRFRSVLTGASSEATTAVYVDTVNLAGYSYTCNQPAANQLLLKADKTGGKVHLYWIGGIPTYSLNRSMVGGGSAGPYVLPSATYDDNVLADTNSYQWVVQ